MRRSRSHNGLIFLIPIVNRVVQQRLYKAALDELAVIGEPVNRVLEVDLDGDEVALTLYDLPTAQRLSPVRRLVCTGATREGTIKNKSGRLPPTDVLLKSQPLASLCGCSAAAFGEFLSP